LEVSKDEEKRDVPVFAVSDGRITFAGEVSGYGGLILLDVTDDSHTALYGHVKLSGLKVKAGDSVKAGQELAYLGDAFSDDTGGERKHLHFGIYNGKEVYYRGYEKSEAAVQRKWVDPKLYLKEKGAKEVNNGQNENVNHGTIQNEISGINVDANNTTVKFTGKLFNNFLEYLGGIFNMLIKRL